MGIRLPWRLFGSQPLGRGTTIASILGLALLCSVPATGPTRGEDAIPALDEKLAATVLPYAKMACEAYAPCSEGDLAEAGYVKDMDWKTAMKREVADEEIISKYEVAGFAATVYRNDRNEEIVIVYRGAADPAEVVSDVEDDEIADDRELDVTDLFDGDWPIHFGVRDLRSRSGKLRAQHAAARLLAARIHRAYARTPHARYKLTLVGHARGASLAAYAGRHVKAAVYTFDPAGKMLTRLGASPNHLTIITRGDPVSDARAAKLKVAGRIVRVDLPPTLSPVKNRRPEVILSRISSLARTARPTTPHAPPPAAPAAAPRPAPSLGTFAAPGPTTIVMRAPGGISLNRAAAERMAIDLDLDGAWYRDGKLVLSGRKSSAHTLDAALMMTAFRAACESGDPYFSLDPDSGAAWSEEGHKASDELWQAISRDIGWNAPVRATRKAIKERSLDVRSIWARRDYPQLWSKVSSAYPNLRSKLVFRPVWLNETRFGEILYQADVLLKELASGTSVLQGGPLRAAKVGGYVSQANRSNAKNLLASLRGEKIKTQWQGSRFWFDVTPRGADRPTASETPSGDRDVLAALRGRGMIPPERPLVHKVRNLVKDSQALDLTNVYPTMFVRRRDMVKEVDIPDDDPIMNAFSADINDNVEKYVAQYKELQALTEAIRAYVVAIHVIKDNNAVCRRLVGMPLLESEKASRPLPPYHPSELMIAIARYQFGDGRRSVRTQAVRSMSIQGGVSIAGKTFYSTVEVARTPTDVTRLIKIVAEADKPPEAKKDDDRRYLFLAVDLDAAAAR
jgi:hypothetical protein